MSNYFFLSFISAKIFTVKFVPQFLSFTQRFKKNDFFLRVDKYYMIIVKFLGGH